MISEQLNEIYQLLLNHFGPQDWWPGETQFEIITGAILTQNTNWANVEKAIANLKSADSLSPEKLQNLKPAELAELIRPAGYFNVKAKRLKNFLSWLFENYAGRLENLEKLSTDKLRTELLSVNGIGPETADSILLYAFDRAIFVDYEQLQYLFQSNLLPDAKLFNEYHGLMVCLGKNFCKPKPNCPACPLKKLPHTIDFEYS